MKLNAQVIEKMQSVNLDAVDKETLVDASGFVFDNSPSSCNLPRTAPLSRNC